MASDPTDDAISAMLDAVLCTGKYKKKYDVRRDTLHRRLKFVLARQLSRDECEAAMEEFAEIITSGKELRQTPVAKAAAEWYSPTPAERAREAHRYWAALLSIDHEIRAHYIRQPQYK